MNPIELLLRGVLVPAVVSGGLLLLLLRLRGAAGSKPGLAVAAGLIAAQAAISQWPTRWIPLEGRDWLPWITAAAAVIGGICALLPVLAVPTRVLAAVALPWILLGSYIEYSWSSTEAALWIAAQAVWLLLLWTVLERTARRHPGTLLPATLLLVCGVSAVAIGLSGTALFGQLTGALAAALAPVFVLAWVRPQTPLTVGLVPAALLPLSALWINGAFYAELPPASALLLAAAPLMAGLRGLGLIGRRAGRRGTLLTLLLVMIPLAMALTLAILAFEPDAYGSYSAPK